jgi:hypothetical protein
MAEVKEQEAECRSRIGRLHLLLPTAAAPGCAPAPARCSCLLARAAEGFKLRFYDGVVAGWANAVTELHA